MKNLTILTVLSFCALAWTATVPVDLAQEDTDPKLIINIAIPEDGATPNTGSSSKKARHTDTDGSLSSNKADVDSDIYWRPWNGTLPKDALMGAFGMSQCGVEVPTYMAQVLHKGTQPGILPSQLYKRSKFAVVSYDHKTYKYKNNVKVLCAEDPNIVTWVPIWDTYNFIPDAEKDCVIAGTELDFNTFFGRTVYEGETIIGKVLYRPRKMFFPYYDEEKSIAVNFEVLCYTKAVEANKMKVLKRREQKKLQAKSEEDATKKATTEQKVEVVVTTSPKPFVNYHAETLRTWFKN